MKANKFLGCLGIIALAASMTACSSDDNSDNTGNGGSQFTGYNKGTDGGLVSSDGILFNEDEY
jgi:major membrane immunogen (membrane-anchored lipoprotein)